MKKTTLLKSLLLGCGLIAFSSFNVFSAPFTPGNLVVYRVGDGTAALTNVSTAIFLDEYSTSGTLVQSIAIPTSGDNVLTASGSATSEGLITLSPNRYYLAMTGYNIAPGTTSVAGTTATVANRKILRVDNQGNFVSVLSSTAYSGNNIRGAVTTGNDYWASGTSSGTIGGVQYFGSGSPVQVSSTSTNIRAINIFNGQLYYSSAAGTGYGIFKVGNGLPVSTGETSTLMINGGSTESCYGFSINSSTDVCYIADDRSSALGGIQKWTVIDGVWTLAYTMATGTNIGARGIIVDWLGSNPVIYATTTSSKIVKIIDTGSGSAYTELATASTNTAFRGIAFAPDLNTSTGNVKSNTWSLTNNTLSFNELPTSKVEIYTLTGSKAAVYDPAQNIEIKLTKGVYILKINNQSSKIMLK